MSNFYVIHDFDPELKRKYGSKNVPESELQDWNRRGFGIHYTPNDFDGNRCAQNLAKINYWIADIDEGTKEDMMVKIERLPLYPNKIIETKRGYHCYWKAMDASKENYRKIEEGIISKLGADMQCKDVCHTLRAPGFYHLKDPKDPFLVKVVFKNEYIGYTEKQMLMAFAKKPKPVSRGYVPAPDASAEELLNPDNWEKFFHISRIGPGNRNGELARITMWLRDANVGFYNADSVIHSINSLLVEPLPEREISVMLKYHFGRKG